MTDDAKRMMRERIEQNRQWMREDGLDDGDAICDMALAYLTAPQPSAEQVREACAIEGREAVLNLPEDTGCDEGVITDEQLETMATLVELHIRALDLSKIAAPQPSDDLKILDMPQGRRAIDAPQSGAHGTLSSPDTSNRHNPPQWVTSWPEWFGLGPITNVTVVPKDDYDALQRDLGTAYASLAETTRIANEEMDRHKKELAELKDKTGCYLCQRREQEATKRAAQAEAELAAIKAGGKVVVPREPTDNMISAGQMAVPSGERVSLATVEFIYKAMLAAGEGEE